MKNFKAILFICLLCGFISTGCGSLVANDELTEMPITTGSLDADKAFREGMQLLDLNNRILARKAFTEALRTDDKFGMAYLMRANTATSAKEFADDLEAGKKNVGKASKWEKWYADAMATNLTGERAKRLEIMEKLALEYPKVARAQVELGNEYAANLQTDKAREAYMKAVALNPEWVGGYSALANSYLFDNPIDLQKAETNALKLVELYPISSGMHIILGDCYRAQDDLAKARAAYYKAVEMDTDNPISYYKLGHANSYLGNFEEARKNYAAAGEHDVRKAGSILYAAYTWLYSGDPAMATKFIMDHVASEPDMNASEKNACLNTIAEIATHSNDAATLKKAVDMINPLNEQINRDLGNTAEIRIYGSADSLHWQAMLAMVGGNHSAAMTHLEAMKKTLEPIDDKRKLEGYEHDMGLLEMRKGNYSAAVSHFEKANPNDMYNRYCLAKANEAAGNKDKATALYREVAAYNFNDVGNALMRNEVKKKLAGV